MNRSAKPSGGDKRSPPLRLMRCQFVRGFFAGMPQPSLVLRLAVSDNVKRWDALHDLPAVRQRLAPLSLDRQGVRFASSISPTAASQRVRHVVEQVGHIVAALQESAGLAVFARALVTRLVAPRTIRGTIWTVEMMFPSPHPAILARVAPELVRILNIWLGGKPFEILPNALEKVVAQLEKYAPRGKNMRLLLDAAHRLDIPSRLLSGRVTQFGWGSRSRLMDSTITDRTSAIATGIARDKRATNRFLAAQGIPVPRQVEAPSLDAALAAARELGFPVVAKPANLDGGVAVTAGIEDEATLRRAYELARRHSPQVVIESHIAGQDFRLGVIHGEMAWATSREPAGVHGDGLSTVQQLLDVANLDVRRGTRSWSLMTPLSINEEATALLEAQAVQMADVPEEGRFVRLRSAANISSGGRARDVRALVHPDNAELAVRAARLLRLDVAGIDLIIPDVSRSWREVGGAICEVNAQPQFTLDVLDAPFKIVAGLFEGDGRIPVIVVLGGADVVDWEALRDQFLAVGLRPGFLRPPVPAAEASAAQGSKHSAFEALQTLLGDPDADAVVALVDDESWLATGAPTDRIDLLLCASGASARMRSLLAPMCSIAVRDLGDGQLTNMTDIQALAQEAMDLLCWHDARAPSVERVSSSAISASPYCRAMPPIPGTIGLCMIARDEAHVIRNSLDSVLGLVDFVLVEDTGSSDGTPEIVRQWLAENGVAGEVLETPWRDFAWNRTCALAHLRAHHDVDYALVLDADDLIVRAEGFDVEQFKASLSADVYDLTVHYNGLRFPRPHLLRNAKAFGFHGVLHEFVDVPSDSVGRAAVKEFHIQAFSRGARSRNPRKYLDDIQTLDAALKVEREPRLRSRYLFYLAQSYSDAGNDKKALELFLERADFAFWPEEMFVAAYRAAKLREKLGHPGAQVEAAYRRAISIMPDRQEAYHGLSRFFRQTKNFEAGFQVGNQGLLQKARSGLFVEIWIYDYGLLIETAMNAFSARKFRECAALCRLIAEKKDVPPSIAARARHMLTTIASS